MDTKQLQQVEASAPAGSVINEVSSGGKEVTTTEVHIHFNVFTPFSLFNPFFGFGVPSRWAEVSYVYPFG